jgi:hypothetical protein
MVDFRYIIGAAKTFTRYNELFDIMLARPNRREVNL